MHQKALTTSFIVKILSLLILILSLSACSFTSVSLFIANSMASFGDYKKTVDLSYGSSEKQRLDIYHVDNEQLGEAAPVVIFYYGGCWGACTDLNKTDYRFVAESLVNKNTVVVVPDYQQYPEVLFAGIMQDVSAVVAWVQNNIADYGGDPNRIFLMGHSSGAHLASMLTLNEEYLSTERSRSIKGFIGLAGPYDFLPFTKSYQPTLFGPEPLYALSQPVNFVDGNEPPLLLLYGGEDDTIRKKNMVSLREKVLSAGGQVKTKTYADLSHAGLLAALSIPLRSGDTVREDIHRFILENH
jgi:acetyl esterase/lipase